MVSSENNRVFRWKAFGEWNSALKDMFKDILTPELETKVRQNRATVEYCDILEPFEKLSGHSIGSMVTTEKVNEFRQRYSHIRVYHGCRPKDIKSYYEKGVLPSIAVKDIQVARFREIFLSGDFPEITEEMLQQSVEKVGSRDEDLCLIIDDRAILGFSGHYLIYGSEYLTALITNLPIENSQEKYFPVLRKIGKPTFVKINLPNTSEYVTDNTIMGVIKRMITEWVYIIAHSKTECCTFNCTIPLFEPLPPEYIVSCDHPRKITDPLMGYKKYDAETGEYEQEDSEES